MASSDIWMLFSDEFDVGWITFEAVVLTFIFWLALYKSKLSLGPGMILDKGIDVSFKNPMIGAM
ncbi:hypothetical protein [Zymomonas mobilis]|uniref:hypothetical protein n=1 Tax=Zymomonas mobilis TaxID=542 RepID=UPI000317FD58|nr:hypothetical protein [Zymomonas mobilis]